MSRRPGRRWVEAALVRRAVCPPDPAHRARVLAAVELVLEDAARPEVRLSMAEWRALVVSGLAAMVLGGVLLTMPVVRAADAQSAPKPRAEWRWIDSRAMLGSVGMPGL